MASRSKASNRGSKRKAGEDASDHLDKKDKPEPGNVKEEKGHKIVIEHWHADAVKSALQDALPAICVELNPQKPRRNSFEITLVDASKETCLWTGIKKGPPRKLKFPDPAEIVTALKKALNTE